MGIEQAIEQIIADRRKIPAGDEKKLFSFIEEYKKILRKHFLKRNRTELAVIFVAFCEEKISEKLFSRRVKALYKRVGAGETACHRLT